jgi:DNA-binding CsgD family transcriptional regulator
MARSAPRPPARGSRGLLHGSPQIDSLLLRLHASADIPQFWAALQEVLRDTVPHDALVAYLNFLDFATSWQATQILATPNARRPAAWFQHRRAVDMTPRFVLAQPRPVKVYRLSDVVPDPAELRRSAFFREFLAPGGWHHLAVSLFWRGEQVGSQIALRRTAAQGDFTAAEIVFLEALHPHVETVLGRLLALEEERARRRSLESFNHHLPFALLFLDWQLAPLHVNQAGLELCARWNFGPEKARAYQPRAVFAPPADILRACAALKSDWLARQSEGEAGPLGATTLAHPQQPGLSATIRLHSEEHARAAYPGFIVYLEDRSTAPEPEHLAGQSLLARLTAAEREIARAVCAGHGNDEIARRLRKSVKTVKAQLTSIYRKLGVAGRSQLLVRLR